MIKFNIYLIDAEHLSCQTIQKIGSICTNTNVFITGKSMKKILFHVVYLKKFHVINFG